jgi:hypothetical protein
VSWQAYQWAVHQRAGSAGAKAVLMVLAEAARDDACRLSQEAVAERSEMDRRSVLRHMATLEEVGLITRERRFDASGHRSPDTVRLRRGPATQGDNLSPSQDANMSPGPSDNLSPRDENPTRQIRRPKVTKKTCLGDSLSQHKEEGSEKVLKREERARRAETQIPNGFPDELAVSAAAVFFREKGFNVDAAAEAEKFRLHALSNDRRLRNWEAGFQMWTRKALQWAPKLPHSVATIPDIPEADQWDGRIAGFRKNGWWNANEWGPKPEKPGCNAPAMVLIAHGYSPGGGVVVLPVQALAGGAA